MDNELHQLRNEVRLLKAYALGATMLFALVALSAFRSTRKQQFREIDVERINVVEPDGDLAMVIANTERLPGVIYEGTEHSDREHIAGMLFYSSGDEVGGLTYSTLEEDGKLKRAFRHLSFDQFRSDQVLVLNYGEDEGERAAGLRIVDRSPEITMGEVLEKKRLIQSGTPSEQEEARRWMSEHMAYGNGWGNRIVVASHNGSAIVSLNDTQARPRIRMSVDSADVARLEFLDEDGNIVLQLPGAESRQV